MNSIFYPLISFGILDVASAMACHQQVYVNHAAPDFRKKYVVVKDQLVEANKKV